MVYIWEPYYNKLKAIFYVLKLDYRVQGVYQAGALSCMCGSGQRRSLQFSVLGLSFWGLGMARVQCGIGLLTIDSIYLGTAGFSLAHVVGVEMWSSIIVQMKSPSSGFRKRS